MGDEQMEKRTRKPPRAALASMVVAQLMAEEVFEDAANSDADRFLEEMLKRPFGPGRHEGMAYSEGAGRRRTHGAKTFGKGLKAHAPGKPGSRGEARREDKRDSRKKTMSRRKKRGF
jgi:hypothetical protein